MEDDGQEITNRLENWGLNTITCNLCGEELGYSQGFPDVWCDYCAKQPEKAEDLE